MLSKSHTVILNNIKVPKNKVVQIVYILAPLNTYSSNCTQLCKNTLERFVFVDRCVYVCVCVYTRVCMCVYVCMHTSPYMYTKCMHA